jgi:hypothetical protein|uniref:Uncharacterized protein n=1 Tax=Picea glauca TaxID=3330 RepID=A0A101LX43_PICGL|nr:hypothetical protein ABT39_MTgene5980 [Picea glauca]QHR88501.1 hypothetical protein Q903MT_gene2515 [Picea sitchensis]
MDDYPPIDPAIEGVWEGKTKGCDVQRGVIGYGFRVMRGTLYMILWHSNTRLLADMKWGAGSTKLEA